MKSHPTICEGEVKQMSKKILVIDDDPDIAEALRLTLQGIYDVHTATNGQEGLRKVKEVKPDLIILDVMMETATEGFQMSLALRSSDPDSEFAEFSKVPILMLTAIHQTTPLRFAPDSEYLPVDDFVEKPVKPSILLAKVKKLLGQAGTG
jgi:CheY-like chemotaxis protein